MLSKFKQKNYASPCRSKKHQNTEIRLALLLQTKFANLKIVSTALSKYAKSNIPHNITSVLVTWSSTCFDSFQNHQLLLPSFHKFPETWDYSYCKTKYWNISQVEGLAVHKHWISGSNEEPLAKEWYED